MTLSKSEKTRLSKARAIGGTPSVSLSDGEMLNLLKLTAQDLDLEMPDRLDCDECNKKLEAGFFEIEIDNLDCPNLESTFSLSELTMQALGELIEEDRDIFTYYALLVDLHTTRRKFEAICQTQDIPNLEEIVPEGLLEIGKFDEKSIVSWLIWRKFIYNVTNRAAKNTGDLFEPILTEAIGGASYNASESPIEKTDGDGKRQADCIAGDHAYEFKKRVTVAASGKGRFKKELAFAEDASNSGYTPILLVLDPTSSKKLEKLSAEFEDYGGDAYVGDEAWDHLEKKAGDTMSKFLEKYVRDPISRIDQHEDEFYDMSIKYENKGDSVTISVEDTDIQLR